MNCRFCAVTCLGGRAASATACSSSSRRLAWRSSHPSAPGPRCSLAHRPPAGPTARGADSSASRCRRTAGRARCRNTAAQGSQCARPCRGPLHSHKPDGLVSDLAHPRGRAARPVSGDPSESDVRHSIPAGPRQSESLSESLSDLAGGRSRFSGRLGSPGLPLRA